MLAPANFDGVLRGATIAGANAIKSAQRQLGVTVDGALGPKTLAALLAELEDRVSEAPTLPATPDAKALARDRIVDCAESFIGDVDPVDVWREVCPELARPEYRHDKSWCGGQALRVWKRTLPKCAAWMWDASGGASGGFVGPHGVRIVSLPERGDIAYWPTLNGATVHHYAIVERVTDGIVYSIDGNVTRAPSERVERRDRSILHTRPVFYSAEAYL